MKRITIAQARDLQLTLQYCLETFEQTCSCGQCDPCTKGQEDIKRSIRVLDNVLNQGK